MNIDYSKLEESLVISEYESLREEIQARLSRVFRLQQSLLLGTLIYATTFYLPKLLDNSTIAETSKSLPIVALLYYSFLLILPFVAFVVELLCTSEQDAIFRAGIYIKDNIEKNYRQSTFRGWEDWLDRQDKVERRRTSDNLIIFARRYIIIPLYCVASSFICTLGLISSFQVELSVFRISLLIFAVFSVYFILFFLMVRKLNKAQKDEFTSPIYNLLVLDVDGCLLDRNKTISKANLDAVEYLKRRGVHIVLSSGRGALSLRSICQQLNLKGLHVSCHGAAIYDATNHSERQLPTCLSKQDLNIIMRKLNEVGINWAAFGAKNYYCRQKDIEIVKRNLVKRVDLAEENLDVVVGVEDVLIYDFPENISKILCYVGVDERTKRTELSKSLSKQFTVIMSTDETLEIIHKDALKERAVEQIIRDYDNEPIRSIVVGDYDNDIGVLKWGHQAVAPSNASMGVRKLNGVNVLETSNDEDLIWEIARAYFNLKKNKPS